MTPLLETRVFWWALAVVLYPVLFVMFVFIAVMPPLNFMFVPVWFGLFAGAVGTISNRLAQIDAREARQREERLNAPGVVPVQRTNAL